MCTSIPRYTKLKHVFKNFRLYQIVVLNWIFDKMNIFVLAFCTQAWTSSFFVPKMLFEPYNFRYFLRVLRVLHGIPRTQLEQTRLQRRVQHPEIYSCVYMYTLQLCTHTHRAVTKILLVFLLSDFAHLVCFQATTSRCFFNHFSKLLLLYKIEDIFSI